MQIERVEVTPAKDVYHPGEVINIAIWFRRPFVGQCEVGLVGQQHPEGVPFSGTPFAKSSNRLYEGQVYIKEADVGACMLQARLTPVRREPQTLSVGDRIFQIRPLVPLRR